MWCPTPAQAQYLFCALTNKYGYYFAGGKVGLTERGKPWCQDSGSFIPYIWVSYIFLNAALLLFDCMVWHMGSQFPDQALNPCPLQWKHKVPTPGLPVKSLCILKHIYSPNWDFWGRRLKIISCVHTSKHWEVHTPKCFSFVEWIIEYWANQDYFQLAVFEFWLWSNTF